MSHLYSRWSPFSSFLPFDRIHHDRFDPSPAANCYFSHELITLLSAASPPFKKAWAQAVQQASEHTKFENPLKGFSASMAEGRVEAAVIKQPWNVPQSIPTTTVSPRGEPAVDPAIAVSFQRATFLPLCLKV